MLKREFHYQWQATLNSDPHAYWPLISDTNRFNQDTGLPALENLGKNDSELVNARRRLRIFRFGVPITWVEEPFEWVQPYRFGVVRRYTTGPVAEMRVLAELSPLDSGGTRFTYQVWARPRNFLGLIAIPLQIGVLSARAFQKIFRTYDGRAQGKANLILSQAARLASGGGKRLVRINQELLELGVDDVLSARLLELVTHADDMSVANLRPYEWATHWGANRKQVLELFLYCTRLGLLDLSWHLLCPSCRVARETTTTLRALPPSVHCDTCLIDFDTNFEQSVELTFRPNPTIRTVPDNIDFCIAGPQITPHIVAQQLIPANQKRVISPLLEDGRYRARLIGQPGARLFRSERAGAGEVSLQTTFNLSEAEEWVISSQPLMQIVNTQPQEVLFVLERTAWGDKSVTAAEVTALQSFRDLFSNEALRPGDQFSVGRLAIVFTDLRHSTRMYRDIGDAPAFGQVMNHFDLLRTAISTHNGALVKTIGDAVMAVFRRPADAVNAILEAQANLRKASELGVLLELKAGLHFGPCIAVNLNDRLDYFGTTVNLASRLVDLSSGVDLILSNELYQDPEVTTLLASPEFQQSKQQLHIATLKGFENEILEVWRIPNPFSG